MKKAVSRQPLAVSPPRIPPIIVLTPVQVFQIAARAEQIRRARAEGNGSAREAANDSAPLAEQKGNV